MYLVLKGLRGQFPFCILFSWRILVMLPLKKKIMKKESSSIFSHVGLVTLAMIFSTSII